MKPAAITATAFLTLVAVLHLARAVLQIPVIAGDVEFPVSASVVGSVLIGALAYWLWREQRG